MIPVQDGGGGSSRTQQPAGHRSAPLLPAAHHAAHLQVGFYELLSKPKCFCLTLPEALVLLMTLFYSVSLLALIRDQPRFRVAYHGQVTKGQRA